MTIKAQIDRIKKSAKKSAHERISHIGGINPDGTRWRISQRKAIRAIESGKWNFCTTVFGKTVDVVVATCASGNKYLKTENDREQPNTLLSLAECS